MENIIQASSLNSKHFNNNINHTIIHQTTIRVEVEVLRINNHHPITNKNNESILFLEKNEKSRDLYVFKI